MIKTDKEYAAAKVQLSNFEQFYNSKLEELMKTGLSKEEARRSLPASVTYGLQSLEEIRFYEQLKRGSLPSRKDFSSTGTYLIAARIAKGMTQAQLAKRLGVKEFAVSYDENQEYHGISTEKANRILQVLGYEIEGGNSHV